MKQVKKHRRHLNTSKIKGRKHKKEKVQPLSLQGIVLTFQAQPILHISERLEHASNCNLYTLPFAGSLNN
jgi:hypothetical protein